MDVLKFLLWINSSVSIALCNLYVPYVDNLDFFRTLTNAHWHIRITKYYYEWGY